MKKIWFFLEGDSEKHFISNLIRRKFFDSIFIEKDLTEFINKDIDNHTHNLLYCENCNSVDKIPHKINEMYYLIERSGSNDVFIICDVERRLKCSTDRKNQIENKLDDSVDKNKIKHIFFNPVIESLYWECTKIIKEIIELQYKVKFGTTQEPKISLPCGGTHPLDDLKKLFQSCKLKYRESIFSKDFFPRVDYDRCTNKVLKRTISLLQSTSNNFNT